MLKRCWLSLCVASGLLAAPFAAAEPCELTRGPLGNLVVGPDCVLFTDTKHELAERFTRIVTPHLHIDLPDLVAVDGNIEVDALVPGRLNIQVKVLNDGVVPSGDFDVFASLESFSPLQSTPIGQFSWTERFNNLDPGEDVRIGYPVENFNWQHQHEMELTIVVDSMGSAGGEIWESNETNNSGREVCEVDRGLADTSNLCRDGALVLIP